MGHFIMCLHRPQELDEAARRRMVKRIYIPLPTTKARRLIAQKLLSSIDHSINDAELDVIAQRTNGTFVILIFN